jgi:hypothetical protein
MSRRVQRFGIWSIHTPRGAEDPRVFQQSKNGDWPVSLTQRRLGIRLFSPSVYKRSFARMAEWKGYYTSYSKRGPRPRLQGAPNDARDLVVKAKQLTLKYERA